MIDATFRGKNFYAYVITLMLERVRAPLLIILDANSYCHSVNLILEYHTLRSNSESVSVYFRTVAMTITSVIPTLHLVGV